MRVGVAAAPAGRPWTLGDWRREVGGPIVGPTRADDGALREETIPPWLRINPVEKSLAASPTCERTPR